MISLLQKRRPITADSFNFRRLNYSTMVKPFLFTIFLFTLLCVSLQIKAQDSSRIRVSLLTCEPGEELYSIFGHSAIRIIDSNSVTDYVYNYGTFDFEDPDFYVKFIKGKLLYFISVERTDDFINSYQSENRSIEEQLLNLSENEKKSIQKDLNENLKEENKYYKYDFFLDNCTTRLRDIISKNKNPRPVLPAVMPANKRFREAIHEYLRKGGQYWSELGIDILLGAPTDRIMTASEQQFLPYNLMKAIDKCSNTSLVISKSTIYQSENNGNNGDLFKPNICFLLLFLFLAGAIKNKNNFTRKALLIFDYSFFFIVGLLGVLLIFMWVGTDHTMTKNNYNLIWAFPLHLIAAFFIQSENKIIKYYFGFTTVLLSLLIVSWLFLPQQLNSALIIIVLILLTRSYSIYSTRGKR
ncbi:MAG: DUF4105 domain-containing protein [Bacteroidota bacterium]